MIVFELTMPQCGSWNGRWSDANNLHIIVKPDREVPKDVWDQDFYYRWDDGWTACISVKHMDNRVARKLAKMSGGFSGYQWMVDSIIKNKEIKHE